MWITYSILLEGEPFVIGSPYLRVGNKLVAALEVSNHGHDTFFVNPFLFRFIVIITFTFIIIISVMITVIAIPFITPTLWHRPHNFEEIPNTVPNGTAHNEREYYQVNIYIVIDIVIDNSAISLIRRYF